MRRRQFLGVVGGVAAWPVVARAQQPAMPVIGFLNGGSRKGYEPWANAFLEGLKEAGYVAGQNAAVEYRWAEGLYDQLPTLAADLVRRQVTVIAGTSTPAALAAKAATNAIPIVFTTSGDPVQLGLVSSLSRPEGNVTGATQLNVEVAPKRLELLRDMIPSATTFALLVNPKGPAAESHVRHLEAAARTLGLKLQILRASTESDLEVVFSTLRQLQIRGLVVGSADPFFTSHREQLAALALRYRIPAAYQYREFAAAGGLMSYGGSITDTYRLAGIYAGRILKGEKPAALPVQQTTKVELILNLRTAKSLGLTFPLSLLGRADEVIE